MNIILIVLTYNWTILFKYIYFKFVSANIEDILIYTTYNEVKLISIITLINWKVWLLVFWANKLSLYNSGKRKDWSTLIVLK